ncbi:MAG: hypothetical protein ABJN34_15105 [Litoreibacter sp.]|uniref:hypothetical protein n=1 Tax=Litoreibacter sp. TaxID=1969459 RepID=UPI0032988525
MRKLIMSCAALAVTAGLAGAQENNLGDDSLILALNNRHVDIKGGVFFPPLILASAGETITISNEEDSTHDATAIDGSWTTGAIAPGESVEVTVVAEMVLCFQSSYNEELKGAVGSPETGEAPECHVLSGEGDGQEDIN